MRLSALQRFKKLMSTVSSRPFFSEHAPPMADPSFWRVLDCYPGACAASTKTRTGFILVPSECHCPVGSAAESFVGLEPQNIMKYS